MYDPKDAEAEAARITDPDQISEIAQRLIGAMIEQYPDFEQVAFYFKRAVTETWPKAVTPEGFDEVMFRGREIMEMHHAHLLHMIYGDHGYSDDVRELIEVLAKNVYNQINGGEEVRPTWNPKWIECATELGVKPDDLKSHEYLSWMNKKIARKAREEQGERMGVDPDKVKPYDYESWLMGNVRRRK